MHPWKRQGGHVEGEDRCLGSASIAGACVSLGVKSR